MSDGKLQHRKVSETASTVGNKLYGPSGVIPYQVIVVGGGGRRNVVVDAATGDDAAEMALRQHPGCKVSYVGPASNVELPRLADEVAE